MLERGGQAGGRCGGDGAASGLPRPAPFCGAGRATGAVPGKHSESARILLGPAVQLISRCGLGNLVVESDKDSLSQTLPTVARLTDTGSDGNDRLGEAASGFGVELTGAIFLTPTKARHGPPSFLSIG